MKLSRLLCNFNVYSNTAINPGKEGLIYVDLSGHVTPEEWKYLSSKLNTAKEKEEPVKESTAVRVLGFSRGVCTNSNCDICCTDI